MESTRIRLSSLGFFSRMVPKLDPDDLELVNTEDDEPEAMTMREYRQRILNFNAYVQRCEARGAIGELHDELDDWEGDIGREAAALVRFCPTYKSASARLRLNLAHDLNDVAAIHLARTQSIVRFR